jgi:hypothetical protein
MVSAVLMVSLGTAGSIDGARDARGGRAAVTAYRIAVTERDLAAHPSFPAEEPDGESAEEHRPREQDEQR